MKSSQRKYKSKIDRKNYDLYQTLIYIYRYIAFVIMYIYLYIYIYTILRLITLLFVEHFDSGLFTFYTIYTYAPLLK